MGLWTSIRFTTYSNRLHSQSFVPCTASVMWELWLLCGLTTFFTHNFINFYRDGMNLVAQEYIACQDGAYNGVLVLSEFAGVIFLFYSLHWEISVCILTWKWCNSCKSLECRRSRRRNSPSYHDVGSWESPKMQASPQGCKQPYIPKMGRILYQGIRQARETFSNNLNWSRVARLAENLDRTPRLTKQILSPAYKTARHRVFIFWR